MAVLQRSMNFFTDVSHRTKSPLSQKLLAPKGGSLLSSFLNRVSAALQEEYKKPLQLIVGSYQAFRIYTIL